MRARGGGGGGGGAALPPASQNVTSQELSPRGLLASHHCSPSYTWSGLYAAPAEYPIDVLRPRDTEAVLRGRLPLLLLLLYGASSLHRL